MAPSPRKMGKHFSSSNNMWATWNNVTSCWQLRLCVSPSWHCLCLPRTPWPHIGSMLSRFCSWQPLLDPGRFGRFGIPFLFIRFPILKPKGKQRKETFLNKETKMKSLHRSTHPTYPTHPTNREDDLIQQPEIDPRLPRYRSWDLEQRYKTRELKRHSALHCSSQRRVLLFLVFTEIIKHCFFWCLRHVWSRGPN